MTETQGWFYVPRGSQPIGPYDEPGLKDLVTGGYVDAATCVWREGRDSWAPIAEVEELKHLLQHAPAVTAPQPSNSQAAVPDDPELAAFEAEIHAIEAEAPGEGVTEAPATPEELEFKDDDGTWYIWDRTLRKYVDRDMDPTAAAAAAAGTSGGAGDLAFADMVYTGDDEVIPTLAAARAAEEAAAAALEEKNGGKGFRNNKRKEGEDKPGSGAGNGNGSGQEARGEGDADDPEHEAAAAALLEAAGGPGKAKKPKKERKVPGQGAGAAQQPATWFDLKVNTSVYVTGLPDDVTVAELAEVFGKYGMIKEDEKGQPRIKIYQDKATGMPKGDALVTYLKEPSVALAVQILDGSPFRFNMGTNMSVSEAKFEMKGDSFQPKQSAAKKLRKKQLEKQEKRLQWGGFDDKVSAEKVTVIIKKMFSPDDFLEDFMLSEELERDVKAECEKLGPVEKLKLFKNHPDGVVSVKFKEPEAAQKCVQLMNGRWFGGRQLESHMYDGVTNYAFKVKESWEEQEARLEAFAKELEAKEDKEKGEAAAAAAAAAQEAAG